MVHLGAGPHRASPLTGEDTQFEPLSPEQGARYGGGRRYILTDLASTQRLPYRYAELFQSRTAPRS